MSTTSSQILYLRRSRRFLSQHICINEWPPIERHLLLSAVDRLDKGTPERARILLHHCAQHALTQLAVAIDPTILAYSKECFGSGGWINLLAFCLDVNRKRAKKYEHEEGALVFRSTIRSVCKLNEMFSEDVHSELRLDHVEELVGCVEGLRVLERLQS